jgi:hypothetical protein
MLPEKERDRIFYQIQSEYTSNLLNVKAIDPEKAAWRVIAFKKGWQSAGSCGIVAGYRPVFSQSRTKV